jgi:serine protease Do
LSGLSDDLRRKFKIKSGVNGVLVTGVDPSVATADPDKRLAPGDVIVEVQYEAVASPADMQKRLEAVKTQGKKIAVLLVSNGAGDTRFVALNLR